MNTNRPQSARPPVIETNRTGIGSWIVRAVVATVVFVALVNYFFPDAITDIRSTASSIFTSKQKVPVSTVSPNSETAPPVSSAPARPAKRVVKEPAKPATSKLTPGERRAAALESQRAKASAPEAQRAKTSGPEPSHAPPPVTVRRASLVQMAQPEYPRNEPNAGIGGYTQVMVTIDDSGNVQAARISRSSGNRNLDRAAMNAAHASRYQAGLNERGEQYGSTVTVQHDFRAE